jgi:hypothetical protein
VSLNVNIKAEFPQDLWNCMSEGSQKYICCAKKKERKEKKRKL